MDKMQNSSRNTMRGILLSEALLSDQFIFDKAEEQGLEIDDIQQGAYEVKLKLRNPGDDNAIRRFKTQLRIQQPFIKRIEVRQPEGYHKPEEPNIDADNTKYAKWRRKMIRNLYAISKKFGWAFFTNPKASVNTEYFFMQMGSGKGAKVVKIRLSDHPSWEEDSDISLDMTRREAGLSDLKVVLNNKMSTT